MKLPIIITSLSITLLAMSALASEMRAKAVMAEQAEQAQSSQHLEDQTALPTEQDAANPVIKERPYRPYSKKSGGGPEAY